MIEGRTKMLQAGRQLTWSKLLNQIKQPKTIETKRKYRNSMREKDEMILVTRDSTIKVDETQGACPQEINVKNPEV
jgi:hypothetical protein